MAPKETFAHILLLLLLVLSPGARAKEPGNDFNVVESSFRQGDAVRIKGLHRTSGSITLLVDYVLGSEEQATLHLMIAGNSPTKSALDPRQKATISKGAGTVMLHFPHAYPGLPCVSLNHISTARVLGHLYFGNAEDVAAARMPGVGLASSGIASATPSGMVQVKLAKIILPRVECEKVNLAELFEYLSVVSRDYDPTVADPRLKGLPIMVTSTRKESLLLSLSLQNVPLAEAIRHAAKLGNLSVSYTDTGVVIGDPEGLAQTPAPASPVPAAPAPATPKPQQAPEGGNLAAKASQIIFPIVNVENLSLEEMIEYIRLKSRDLDTEHRGVDIIIKPGATSHPLLTFELREIPLPELLHYVAELSNYDLVDDSKRYMLKPRS